MAVEQKAFIVQNVASMRAEPDARSERVSQAILGDPVTILEAGEEYSLIRTQDEYEGWTRTLWLSSEEEVSRLSVSPDAIREKIKARVIAPIVDFRTGLEEDGLHTTKLVFGTTVSLSARKAKVVEGTKPGSIFVQLRTGETGFLAGGTLLSIDALDGFKPDLAIKFARQFTGTPYLWGGTTAFGYDCSGFVQRLYSMFGVILPRDAYKQAVSTLGSTLEKGEDWRVGDLVFFTSERDPLGRGITHVGMAIDRDRFIHASGKLGVAITPQNDPYYTQFYLSAWRYLAISGSKC